jgi:hypothetical protein
MGRPRKPTDLYVVNGWYLDLPGLDSPHFETLQGLQQAAGNVTIVDGGTNKKLSFSDQLQDFGTITLTRTLQGTPDDIAVEDMAKKMISQGMKVNGTMVKLHHGDEVFSVLLEGFKINSRSFPNFDVNSGEKCTMTYQATCDDWEIVRPAR